jgi:hypothetical protein
MGALTADDTAFLGAEGCNAMKGGSACKPDDFIDDVGLFFFSDIAGGR